MNTKKQKHHIHYTCDAAGIKLKKTDGSTKTDYVGNFIYEDNLLKYIITDYGKITSEINATDTGFTRQYDLNAHPSEDGQAIGNVRVTFDVQNNNTADIVQEDSYYPFGMRQAGLSYSQLPDDENNKYLYNGKELQEDFGLDWYDYGARFYDAELGRWHVPDALAEQAPGWSPYRYAFNNPVSITDPDGNFEDGWIYDQENNKIKHINDVGGKNTQFVTYATKNEDGSYSDTGGTEIWEYKDTDSKKSDCPFMNFLNSFDKTDGGFSMTKSEGQGNESKVSANPDDIGNVDVLMAALATAMKATDTPNVHSLEEIGNFVMGNIESGMDIAETIKSAVSSDASGNNSSSNSTINNLNKSNEKMVKVKFRNPNYHPDTMYQIIPEHLIKSIGEDVYKISDEEYKKHKK